MARRGEQAKETLSRNREDVLKLVQGKGLRATQKLLEKSADDLNRRLTQAEGFGGPGADSFTATQLRTALVQVRHVLRELVPGLKDVVVEHGQEAAGIAAHNTAKYMEAADKAFRGVGVQPLAINTARMMDRATMGARSSVLHRLASDPKHPAKAGVLQRYGARTIGVFEETLQKGLIAKKSFREMRDEITTHSPFLQKQPKFWADRIVRTEVQAAHNHASWEAAREADDELGDVVKILAATFDDRTAADSYAVHGQIRRVDEPFESWYGLMEYPPARPNDREIVVIHRIAWEIPEYLEAVSDDIVEEVYEREKHKEPMPERPEITTVELELFGTSRKSRGE